MRRNYVGWYRLKAALNEKQVAPDFSQRDVWWCSLGANIGFEEDGKNVDFERPVLVIRKFSKELFIGIPLSTSKKDNKFYHPIKVAGKNSAVILSQQRALSSKRLLRRIGRVGESDFTSICKRLTELIENANPATSAGFSDAKGDLYSNYSKQKKLNQVNQGAQL